MNTTSTTVQPAPGNAPATGTATRSFQLWLAITGTFAPSIIDTIKVPKKVVRIVYERDIPIPRLWHDKKDGVWKPESIGASLFDPSSAWSIDVIDAWCERFAQDHKSRGGGEAIFDIEDVHPFKDSMQRNAKPNYDALLRDILARFTGIQLSNAHDMIAFALRQVWSRLMDGLVSRGVDASFYGHTPEHDGNYPNGLRDGRCWFDSRQRRTHPVIYEWHTGRNANAFQFEVIRPRVRAAIRLSPLAPCFPFIWPFMDDGSNKPVSPEHFASMVRVSREEGAAGVVLWHHADTTKDLTRWVSNFDTVIAPAMEGLSA